MTRSSDQCILYILYHDKVLWVEILNALVVCFLYIRPFIKQIKINICQIPSNIKVIWIYIVHTHIYIYMYVYATILCHDHVSSHVTSRSSCCLSAIWRATWSDAGNNLMVLKVCWWLESSFAESDYTKVRKMTNVKTPFCFVHFSWQVIRLVAPVWRTLKAQKVAFTVV